MIIVCRYVIKSILICMIAVMGISCDLNSSTSTIEPPAIVEPQIPDGYSSYESEEFFKISYPSDWEPAQSYLEELDTSVNEWLLEADPGVEAEKLILVFFGGKPTEEGWYPSVSIMVGELEFGYSDLDEIIEIEHEWSKTYVPGYKEFSRKKTSIGGQEAYIINYQDNEPGYGVWEYISVCIVKGDYVWFLNCGTELADFDEYEDTFDNVVRSFRPLN